MTQSLTSTYWCHRDYDGPGRELRDPLNNTTDYPARALVWMLESAGEVLTELDRPTFGIAWAWLGDHQTAGAAVEEPKQCPDDDPARAYLLRSAACPLPILPPRGGTPGSRTAIPSGLSAIRTHALHALLPQSSHHQVGQRRPVRPAWPLACLVLGTAGT